MSFDDAMGMLLAMLFVALMTVKLVQINRAQRQRAADEHKPVEKPE